MCAESHLDIETIDALAMALNDYPGYGGPSVCMFGLVVLT